MDIVPKESAVIELQKTRKSTKLTYSNYSVKDVYERFQIALQTKNVRVALAKFVELHASNKSVVDTLHTVLFENINVVSPRLATWLRGKITQVAGNRNSQQERIDMALVVVVFATLGKNNLLAPETFPKITKRDYATAAVKARLKAPDDAERLAGVRKENVARYLADSRHVRMALNEIMFELYSPTFDFAAVVFWYHWLERLESKADLSCQPSKLSSAKDLAFHWTWFLWEVIFSRASELDRLNHVLPQQNTASGGSHSVQDNIGAVFDYYKSRTATLKDISKNKTATLYCLALLHPRVKWNAPILSPAARAFDYSPEAINRYYQELNEKYHKDNFDLTDAEYNEQLALAYAKAYAKAYAPGPRKAHVAAELVPRPVSIKAPKASPKTSPKAAAGSLPKASPKAMPKAAEGLPPEKKKMTYEERRIADEAKKMDVFSSFLPTFDDEDVEDIEEPVKSILDYYDLPEATSLLDESEYKDVVL